MLRRRNVLCSVLVVVLSVLAMSAGAVRAQEPKSAALAKQLTALFEERKLDAVAAKDPAEDDRYVAALCFKGSQILVVSARYAVPLYINDRLMKRDFKEAYIDLNSASVPDSKVFIVDLQCDGLRATRDENQPFDTYETAKVRVKFDGEWKAQNLTEEQYMKLFAEADAVYARALTALIAEAKQ